MRFTVLVESALRSAHGNHVVEAITSLNTHIILPPALQPVGRIKAAVALGVNGPAPEAFALMGEELFAEIVEVCAFSIKKIAEESLMDEAQDESFVIPIAAVSQA